MGLTLVTGPASSPVSLTEAKAHLRVDADDQDELIGLYIDAETAYAEQFTGRALVPATWDFTRDAFPTPTDAAQRFELPLPRVTDVAGVFYQDEDQVEQELDAALYVADLTSEPARIALADGADWPTIYDGPASVRVRFTAGYVDASSPALADVVADIKLAILLRVQADYDGGDDAKILRQVSEIYLRRRRVHLGVA